LPLAFYACETWSLTLREERRLRVFDSGVLRRIFRPKRNEVTGDGRKLYNEELNDLYSSPFIPVIKTRRMIWAEHIARIWEITGACKVSVEKSKERRQLRRHRRRWENNIKMDARCGAQTGLICLKIGTGSWLL